MKKIINKIKFWQKKPKTLAKVEPIKLPPEEIIPEDELPLHEGHPI